MDAHKHMIERGIAQGGAAQVPLTDFAQKGLLDFLRQQITDAEWEIAKQKARIQAYETAIGTIESKTTTPA